MKIWICIQISKICLHFCLSWRQKQNTGKISLTFKKWSWGQQSRTLWSLPAHPARSSPCLLSVESFSQRISLIREVRYAETKENSQRRLNNNNVIIKHSQGPLVLSQGLKDNSLGHILWVVLYIIKHQVEKLITWWPDCTHDVSCHNS